MNILIDAHLPESLAQYFQGHDVIHVSALPEGNYTKDSVLNQISVLENRALTRTFVHYFRNRKNKNFGVATEPINVKR